MDEERVSAGEVLSRILTLLDCVEPHRVTLDAHARLELVSLARRASDRLAALAHTLVGEADRAHAAETAAGTGLSSWLGLREGMSKQESRTMLARGRTAVTYPAAAAAALAGDVTAGQLVSMGRVLDDLRPSLTEDQRDQAESVLIQMAATMDAQRLAHSMEEVLNEVAPAQAGVTGEALLHRQAERAYRRRSLRIYDDGRGEMRFDGSLPLVDGQAWVSLLDATMSRTRRALLDHRDPAQIPLSTEQRRADALIHLIHTHPGTVSSLVRPSFREPTVAAQPTPSEDSSERGGEEPSDPSASAELTTATCPGRAPEPQESSPGSSVPLPVQDGTLPGQEKRLPLIMVTLDYRRLEEEAVAAGLTVAGAALSAGELRRLACDADLLPAVLGTSGEVLDVGRTHRLVTGPIRSALILRDRGCAFPTCSSPPESCEAHHILPWWRGGETSVANMVLLCAHHHAQVEPSRHGLRDQWLVRIASDGMPEFVPPARMDPYREPIRQLRPTSARGDPPGHTAQHPGSGPQTATDQPTGPPEAA